MTTITVERVDWGLVPVQVRARGKRGNLRKVEEMAFREELIVIVHEKEYRRTVLVPYLKGDPNPAARRLSAMRIAWHNVMDEILVPAFGERW